MVNYTHGKIYKIECLSGNPDDIYIGSTTKQLLSQRMVNHRGNYKSWKNGNSNKMMSFDIFDKYGVENCVITLIEDVNVNNKNELFAREAYYIRTLKCLNKIIPLRNKTEYIEDNKLIISEKRKLYHEVNKEKFNLQSKAYREANKEILAIKDKQKYEANRENYCQKNKEYRQENKEEVAEKSKVYREANKEVIKLRKSQNATCECGCEVRKEKLSRHQQSKKHEELMKGKENN